MPPAGRRVLGGGEFQELVHERLSLGGEGVVGLLDISAHGPFGDRLAPDHRIDGAAELIGDDVGGAHGDVLGVGLVATVARFGDAYLPREIQRGPVAGIFAELPEGGCHGFLLRVVDGLWRRAAIAKATERNNSELKVTQNGKSSNKREQKSTE